MASPLCGFPTENAIIAGFVGQPGPTAEPSHIGPDLPLLLISGDRDPVGGPGGSNVTALADRYRSAGLTDVTATLYPDARHELVNETIRDEVTADVIGWLRAHLPG